VRFGKAFKRTVGGAGTVLGSDSTPTGKPADKNNDNQLSWKLNSINGYPVERVAVGYGCTAAGSALSATLWIYDDTSDAWYQASTATLTLNHVTYFDQPTLSDSAGGITAGCLDVCLVVAAAGGDAAGTYTFTIGMDLSSDGSSIAAGAGNATAANQVLGNASLSSIDGKIGASAAPADAKTNASAASGFVQSFLSAFNGATWDRVRAGVTAVASSFTGMLNSLPWAIYHAAPTVRADAQGGPLEAMTDGSLRTTEQQKPGAENNVNNVIETQNKPVAVADYAWTVKSSVALEASDIIKASPGILRSLSGRIDSTEASSTYYIQLFDAATLPAEATATSATIPAPQKIQHVNGTDSKFSFDYSQNGVAFLTGIVAVLSTTEFTKTIAGSFLSITAEYK